MLRPAFIGALFSACLAAQSALPQFRARTDLVKLDVSVFYPDRQPVHGLEARHFVVLEDGVEQPIETFAEVMLPDPQPLPQGWQRDTGADVVDNADDPAGRIVGIVLDDADPKMTLEVAAATQSAARDVIARLSPGDRGAVLFARQRQYNSVVTSDRAQLLAAVKRFTIERSFFSVPDTQFAAVSAANIAALALGTASDRRKIVVFISPGAPVDMTKEMFDGDASVYWQVDAAIGAADRDNISIYAIDPTALLPAPVRLSRKDEKRMNLRRDFLERFTEWGFGFAVVNSALYSTALDRIFREHTAYYTLGYRTPVRAITKNMPARPLVEVRVKRQGLIVRAPTSRLDDTPRPRPGERAIPPPKPPLTPMLRAMQQSVLPQTALRIRAAAAVFRAPGTNDGFALVTTTVGDDSAAGAVDDTINVALTSTQPLSRDRLRELPTDFVTAKQTGAAPVELQGLLTLRPGYQRLEIAAERVGLARLGSIRMPVDVPNYEKDRFALSGVVVNSATAAATPLPPALAAIVPFPATTRRTFATSERLRVFLQMYVSGKAPRLPVAVTTRLQNAEGQSVFELTKTVAADAFAARDSADVTVEPPLKMLTPGVYLLTIEATRDLTTLRRQVRFDVK